MTRDGQDLTGEKCILPLRPCVLVRNHAHAISQDSSISCGSEPLLSCGAGVRCLLHYAIADDAGPTRFAGKCRERDAGRDAEWECPGAAGQHTSGRCSRLQWNCDVCAEPEAIDSKRDCDG